MLDIALSAILFAGFVYVLMLATNPKGAWNCPIEKLLARLHRSGRQQARPTPH